MEADGQGMGEGRGGEGVGGEGRGEGRKGEWRGGGKGRKREICGGPERGGEGTQYIQNCTKSTCMLINHILRRLQTGKWALLSPNSLNPPTSTCSHLELGLVEILGIDLAKDVVDSPCLDNERAKEEGESQ